MRLAVFCDAYPELSETFILNEAKALAALGHDVRVEAGRHAERANPDADGGPPVVYADDERASWRALAWLVARHPLRSARDRALALARWRREEQVRPLRALAPVVRRVAERGDEHLHAHFAAGAALDAMRVLLLTGILYSVTTHGYDIWQHPRNLREKLARARFHVAVSDYNMRAVAQIQPERLHKVVMGVDGGVFARTEPYPGGRTVVAVGRLVEKKGFVHLVEAARRLPDVEFRIVGGGPLRDQLAGAAGPNVTLVGALAPEGVRADLERADLLALPSVVARDGDRDAMPVAVKEALAMEVPVVASNEVALPEVVRQDWGRLVPPGNAQELAAAIAELLALPAEERTAMGRHGREFVLREYSIADESRKLAELIGR